MYTIIKVTSENSSEKSMQRQDKGVYLLLSTLQGGYSYLGKEQREVVQGQDKGVYLLLSTLQGGYSYLGKQ